MQSLRSLSRYSATSCLFTTLFALGGCHNEGPKPVQQVSPAAVTTVQRSVLSNTLNVAGQFVPYQEVELHARVAGYIRSINVDIGDRVKAGQMLATLDVPDLNAQVQGASAGVRQQQEEISRAQSEVARARANYAALHAAAERLQKASDEKPGLIAEQELDDARSRDLAAAAQVDAAQSNLLAARQQLGVSQAEHLRYSSLADYSHITAPFNGVVTWRYADRGALVQAGTSSGSAPIVKIAQVDILRLRLPVPASLAPFVHEGDTASIHIDSLNRTLQGTVTRTTGALDPNTSSMTVEIDVPNKDNSLAPGMYAEVSLLIHRSGDVLTVPVTAIDRTGSTPYALIVDTSNRVHKRNVQVGLATANKIEIVSGLNAGDRIIATNLTSFTEGQTVNPKQSALLEGDK